MLKNLIVLPDGTEISSGVGTVNAIQSVTLTQCVNSGEELTIGSACAAMLEATILTPRGELTLSAGDEVVLDYAGFCDGVQFPGGTAEMQTLVLGSGMFIPGFEDQLVDKVPGEEVIVKVTFPEQYHSEELAGKEAEFSCVIHEIRVKTPYELDDVFAKEVGGCDTLEEMRQKLGPSMQAYADEQGEMDLQDKLLRQAAATLEVTFTEEELDKAAEEQMQVLQAQLARQGLSLEMY